MNSCGASSKFLVICGREHIYVIPRNPGAPSSTPREVLALNLSQSRPAPADPKKSSDKISGVCATISQDSQYICCSDSDKNVFVFKYEENETEGITWKLLKTFQVEKRLLKVEFGYLSRYLLMVDKCGDLWASEISLPPSSGTSEEEEELGNPQKILGHCSVILDVKLTKDCKRVLTSDRDEKIRISCFPEGFVIQKYLLGHKQAVVSIELLRNEKFLLSVDIDGICKLWDFTNNSCTHTYKLFNLLQLDPESSAKYEINMLSVIEINNRVYFVAKISHYDKVCLFELNVESSFKVTLIETVSIENSKIWDVCSFENTIFIVAFDSFKDSKQIVLKDCNDQGVVELEISNLYEISNLSNVELLNDLNSFAQFNNESYSIPMRKRVYGKPLAAGSGPTGKVPRLELKQSA